MKKREKILILLFLLDLLLLTQYGPVREDARTTFSYKKIIFYWFYFYPLAYFLGGYLLSYFLLLKSKLFLNRKFKRILPIFILICTILYLSAAIPLTIHVMHPVLPDSISEMLAYFVMTIYTRYIFIFPILGFLSAMCFSSKPDRT